MDTAFRVARAALLAAALLFAYTLLSGPLSCLLRSAKISRGDARIARTVYFPLFFTVRANERAEWLLEDYLSWWCCSCDGWPYLVD